jgi:hypothetical protein
MQPRRASPAGGALSFTESEEVLATNPHTSILIQARCDGDVRTDRDWTQSGQPRLHCGTLVSSFASLMSRGLLPFYPLALRRHRIAGALRPRFV